jgi:hypothetical protein
MGVIQQIMDVVRFSTIIADRFLVSSTQRRQGIILNRRT